MMRTGVLMGVGGGSGRLILMSAHAHGQQARHTNVADLARVADGLEEDAFHEEFESE